MHPRLRENIWHIDRQRKSATLVTMRGIYQVPTEPALEFLRIRSYCTGHYSIDAISKKSGVAVADIEALFSSLRGAGIINSNDNKNKHITVDNIQKLLSCVGRLWSQELRISYIGNAFALGELPRTVLYGWLLEMYHYIKDFPYAIEHAAQHATGELKLLLNKYADEERGHEAFVLRTLANLGFSEAEVVSSIPLLSTRLIGLLMRELFEIAPESVLLVASILEAQDFDEAQIEAFASKVGKLYSLDPNALEPYFEHQEIDVALGHAKMLEGHIHLFQITDRTVLDNILNKTHDLKHAFDLQGIEIREYYSRLDGKYIPRQPVALDCIEDETV